MSMTRPNRLLRSPGIIGTRADVVPTWPVELDRSHPLAQGLVFASVPGNTLANLAGPGNLSYTSGAGIKSGILNSGFYVPQTTDYGQYPYYPQTDNIANITMFALVSAASWATSSTNLNFIRKLQPTGSNYGYQLFAELPNNRFVAHYINSGGVQATVASTAGVPVNVPVSFCASLSPTAGKLYIKGALAGTSVLSGFPPNSGSQPIYIGGYAGIAYGLGGIQYCAYIYNIAQSANNAAWLNAEPFAMLRPVIRRGYYTAPNVTSFAPSWLLEWV